MTLAEEYELFEARRVLAQAKAFMDYCNRPAPGFWEMIGSSGMTMSPIPPLPSMVREAEETVRRLTDPRKP